MQECGVSNFLSMEAVTDCIVQYSSYALPVSFYPILYVSSLYLSSVGATYQSIHALHTVPEEQSAQSVLLVITG